MSPASGVRLVTEYRYGQKRVSGSSPASARVPGKADIQRIVTDLELYASPFRRQVVALALHGRQVRGDNVEESEMFRFGGTNSLRGYRENQFLGTLVGWTNAEYRLLLARRSYAFTFFDTGYYRRPADPQRRDGFRRSRPAWRDRDGPRTAKDGELTDRLQPSGGDPWNRPPVPRRTPG